MRSVSLPQVPNINIYKSSKEYFSHVFWEELSFANINCKKSQTVYLLKYPENIWEGKNSYKATKAFFDEEKTYYSTNESAIYFLNDPLCADAKICSYDFIDKNDYSYTTAIHEKFKNNESCTTFYKDGPTHHSLSNGDSWYSESLVYIRENWVLDIACQNTVTSNWIVSINEREIPCIELSLFAVPYRGEPLQKLKPEFINKYYINEKGQCVLLRRYMGPVWETWNNTFWKRLLESPCIEEQGDYFYLYCDYIPKKFL